MEKSVVRAVVSALVAVVLLPGCGTLPPVTDKPVSTALARPSSGPLVKTADRLARSRPAGHSSLLLLEDNREALEWRLALIDSARSSIDIQVYLWHKGASSSLLFGRLLRAADRGVRVRVLVDDFLLQGQERDLAALCREHPNVQIRIFNPRRLRGSALHRAVGFAASFDKLNRRMHNKTWTVDRCMSIVGGRNVADHYFGLDPDYNFIDLDVLVSGPVVSQVAEGFDEFWNSTGAYPGEKLSPFGTTEDVEDLRRQVADGLDRSRRVLQSYPLEVKDWSRELAVLPRKMAHGRVKFIQDHPEKTNDNRYMVNTLRALSARQEKELIVMTPYLLPTKQGMENVSRILGSGVEISVLVPSLGANNHALVHGHYRKHRRPLLEAGVQLYELRPALSAEALQFVDVPPVTAERSCLHGKAIVGDRRRCYIGSLNLDPRAMDINTESGLLIDSKELTDELLAFFAVLTRPENSWKLRIDDQGRTVWTTGDKVQRKEPPAGFKAKAVSGLSGLLPIQSQL